MLARAAVLSLTLATASLLETLSRRFRQTTTTTTTTTTTRQRDTRRRCDSSRIAYSRRRSPRARARARTRTVTHTQRAISPYAQGGKAMRNNVRRRSTTLERRTSVSFRARSSMHALERSKRATRRDPRRLAIDQLSSKRRHFYDRVISTRSSTRPLSSLAGIDRRDRRRRSAYHRDDWRSAARSAIGPLPHRAMRRRLDAPRHLAGGSRKPRSRAGAIDHGKVRSAESRTDDGTAARHPPGMAALARWQREEEERSSRSLDPRARSEIRFSSPFSRRSRRSRLSTLSLSSRSKRNARTRSSVARSRRARPYRLESLERSRRRFCRRARFFSARWSVTRVMSNYAGNLLCDDICA